MQLRAPLMKEHRLIEQMIEIVNDSILKIQKENKVDPVMVDTVVDFIRMYADRTHHGKEEDILFRELEKKNMSKEDSSLMQELLEEHKWGRATTKKLVEANTRYRRGDKASLEEVVSNLELLADFYPRHIEKEDEIFFPSANNYFPDDEEQEILDKFWEFDRKMIHEKYSKLVEDLGSAYEDKSD